MQSMQIAKIAVKSFWNDNSEIVLLLFFCEAIAVTDRVDLLGFIAQFELL